jgi:hypothetical protein
VYIVVVFKGHITGSLHLRIPQLIPPVTAGKVHQGKDIERYR